MRFDLVVFDWDGTLMDSTSAISRSIRLACVDAGLPDPGPSVSSYVIGLGLGDALRHAAPGATERQIQVLVERYRYYYLSRDHELELFEGAVDLMKALREKNVFLAIATGKSRAGLNRVLDQTGIGMYFDASRCADECHSKPHPQMLHELMDEFAVKPAHTVMIGDTTHDLNMAKAAGAHGVAVSTGAHGLDMLMSAEPVAHFASLIEMSPWLIEKTGVSDAGA